MSPGTNETAHSGVMRKCHVADAAMDGRPSCEAAFQPGPEAAPPPRGALDAGHGVRLPLLLVSVLVLSESHQQPSHRAGGAGDDLRAAPRPARGGVPAREIRAPRRRGE